MYVPLMQLLLGISALTSLAIGIVLLISPRAFSLGKAWRIVVPFFIFAGSTALDINSVEYWHPTLQSLVRWFVAPWLLINTLYIVRQLAEARNENASLRKQIKELNLEISEKHEELPRIRSFRG